MPLSEQSIREKMMDYLRDMDNLGTSEIRRETRFYFLLDGLFGVEIPLAKDVIRGMRPSTGRVVKGRVRRGTPDNVLGNLVIEFEGDLGKKAKLREAEGQLVEYIDALWRQEEEAGETLRPYFGIACDGIVLRRYLARRQLDRTVDLTFSIEHRLSNMDAVDAFYVLQSLFGEGKRPATGERLAEELGNGSNLYLQTFPDFLGTWETHQKAPGYKVLHDSWSTYLRKVYSDATLTGGLFVAHTFLVTAAKLICFRAVNPDRELTPDGLLAVLEGQEFREAGIENYIESDFFAWVTREEVWPRLRRSAAMLLRVIDSFDWENLSEDVLKPLYQHLVDPVTRHELGEYYTPDWLADMVVRDRLMQQDETSEWKPDTVRIRWRVLDPACGSGTFIQKTIQAKIAALKPSVSTLQHVLASVIGFDINPIAVVIAKTNYVLALAGMLRLPGRGQITLPIYLADALRARSVELRRMTVDSSIRKYDVEVLLDEVQERKRLRITPALLTREQLFRPLVDAAHTFASEHAESAKLLKPQFDAFIRREVSVLGDVASDDSAASHEKTQVIDGTFHVAEVLHHFIRKKRNSIWAFVLKNRLLPIILSSYDRHTDEDNRIDLLVGNPPWITLKGLDPEYQNYLREAVQEDYKLLAKKDGKNITHIELATLFWVRCADLYLRPGGEIAFVMPRSIFTADHNKQLRAGAYRCDEDPVHGVTMTKVWDLSKVHNLFNIPSAVLFGDKGTRSRSPYPLSSVSLSGTIPSHNASMTQALPVLTQTPNRLVLAHERGVWVEENHAATGAKSGGFSYYHEFFSKGATIVPRCFWFVDEGALIKRASSRLGIDLTSPPIQTDAEASAKAKPPLTNTMIEGNAESIFFYTTVLPKDLYPFGIGKSRLIVLPVLKTSTGTLRIVKDDDLKNYPHLSRWLAKVERSWRKGRGVKADKMTSIQRLDFAHDLTEQHPDAPYIVLYNASGTHVVSAVVDTQALLKQTAERLKTPDGLAVVISQGVIADKDTIYYYARSANEAHYLCAALNAPFLNKALKPLQATGLGGPRHIDKKVLEFPLAKFDPTNANHLELAKISRVLHEQFADGSQFVGGHGHVRGKMRVQVAKELAEIDGFAEGLLR